MASGGCYDKADEKVLVKMNDNRLARVALGFMPEPSEFANETVYFVDVEVPVPEFKQYDTLSACSVTEHTI